MPDREAAAEIRAAGAVLWRPAGRGTQVAVIHRPKYDDWGLPKGKLEPGEHPLLAAVREVSEETGLQVTLGQRLPPVRYLVDGQPKVVDYWAARTPASVGAFTPNHEVDRLDWVALTRATGRLSYDHDAALLADFGAAPRPTVPLILVRHASAGSKSEWHRDDELRPLDSRGKQQAKLLAELLRCFGAGRVLSSRPSAAWPRCGRTPPRSVRRSSRCRSSACRPAGTRNQRAARRRTRSGRPRPVPSPRSQAAISRSSSARTGRTCRRCWRPAAPGWARGAGRAAAAQERIPGAAPGGRTARGQRAPSP